ncbi:MAG: hypothetical protein HON90_15120, partial [Halobacteriovoraceae bacterium]|nr:hypothetical protein [Halobacteriovoraceae bacterium]
MVQKKFELIITSNDIQEILAVGDTPILVGSLDHCSIKISGDEPAIKAVIEKEDDCLAFTIYDNKYPIIIKGKKYKTAKINNPSFIKLGSIDIIINVEEVAIKETLPLDDNETDDEVFSDYSDVSIKNPFPVSIPKTIENSINEKPDLPKVS